MTARYGIQARRACALALVVAATTPGPADAASWLRLRSSHFVVVGDASERDLRHVAERVEGFRDGLVGALPGARVALPVPMTIVVFAAEAGFTPFKPLVSGRPMDRVGGYFLGGEDAHYIAMTLAHGEEAYPTILHEYTHALVAETMPNVPLWLHEGLAEIYGTYTERADGRTALIGRPPAHHLRELQAGPLLPLEHLLSADVSSPLYNEGERRGMFYAQSWVFTHYLLLGSTDRKAQVATYLRLRDQGMAVADAIPRAFGREPKAIEAELREYARLFGLNGIELALDSRQRERRVMTAEQISEAEATTYTAELWARQGRLDDARRALEVVMAANPDLPRGLAARGRLLIRAGQVDEGLPLLARAVAQLPTDAPVAATYARALVDRLRAKGPRAAAADLDELGRVGRALDAAAELDPEDTFVTAMQGYVALLEGGKLDRAQVLLERAVRQAPVRLDYQLLLAQVYIEQRNFAGAQGLLGPLGSVPEPRVRDQARTLLARAAEDAGVTAPASRASRQILILRALDPGESQVLGQFTRVDCRPEAVVLHVMTGDRTLQLRTARLEDVDFINYTDDGIAPIGCRNPEPTLRVVATYRGDTDAALEAVAIEIVPGDFTLP